MSLPMQPPAILVVTGASGAGKTASVRALESLSLPGVRCFYFDSVGVPGTEEMERVYGGGEGWQAAMTAQWMRRLVTEEAEVAVLDGQTRPTVVRAAISAVGAPWSSIVLLDCSPEERGRRLAGPRGQPELASEHMSSWAAYLRGQADALGLPVVDSTQVPVHVVAAKLAAEVERLRQARAAVRADDLGRISLADMRERLTALQSTAERAMAQVSDAGFTAAPDPETNSIAVTVKHVAGNLRSRFTGFGATDGEKPDRDRDGEFVLTPADSRERLMARWSEGWELLYRALDGIDPDQLTRVVTIRAAPHTIIGALNRNLAHVAYHVGQIVQLAKHHAGSEWRTLTIPRGASEAWREERR